MAVYTLNFFDLGYISTDDPDGFSDNGGYQFDWGISTVTLDPLATSTPVSVTDWNDEYFEDDAGGGQVLDGDWTLNGTTYTSGTNIEAEYVVHLEDSEGNPYTLQFVSIDNDAYNIEGFIVQGAMPPRGEPLTVVSTQDMVNDTYFYSTSQEFTPVCFEAATRILTPDGPVPVSRLKRGDRVTLASGGMARVAFMVHTRLDPAQHPEGAPVRLRRDALGPGLPARAVLLSPQHRVYLPAHNALVPAKALRALPRIGPDHRPGPVHYVHVVLPRHALLLAEGIPCESFWPGAWALANLPRPLARRIRALMGPAPAQAAPFLGASQARRMLRNGLPAGAAP